MAARRSAEPTEVLASGRGLGSSRGSPHPTGNRQQRRASLTALASTKGGVKGEIGGSEDREGEGKGKGDGRRRGRSVEEERGGERRGSGRGGEQRGRGDKSGGRGGRERGGKRVMLKKA